MQTCAVYNHDDICSNRKLCSSLGGAGKVNIVRLALVPLFSSLNFVHCSAVAVNQL